MTGYIYANYHKLKTRYHAAGYLDWYNREFRIMISRWYNKLPYGIKDKIISKLHSERFHFAAKIYKEFGDRCQQMRLIMELARFIKGVKEYILNKYKPVKWIQPVLF